MVVHHDEAELPEEYVTLLHEAIVTENTPCSNVHLASRVLDVIT